MYSDGVLSRSVRISEGLLYLHYTSNHSKQTFKGMIVEECIRHARTNTTIEGFEASVKILEHRLVRREYPAKLIRKTSRTISYDKREQFLHGSKTSLPRFQPPVFKCLPPP